MTKGIRYAVVGMSHIEALARGWDRIANRHPGSDCLHYNLRRFRRDVAKAELDLFRHPPSEAELAVIRSNTPIPGGTDPYAAFARPEFIRERFAETLAGCDAAVFLIEGNEHNLIGLLDLHPLDASPRIIRGGVRANLEHWLDLLGPACGDRPAYVTQAPPPIESTDDVLERLDLAFRRRLEGHRIREPADRLALWKSQCAEVEACARRHGMTVIDLPAGVFSPAGFLDRRFLGRDATHGNDAYGELVAEHLQAVVSAGPRRGLVAKVSSHPYQGLAAEAYWKRAVAEVGCVEPIVDPKFNITVSERIATAGSCFAGHIAQRLASSGFNILRAEEPFSGAQDGPPYSANYGNVYTARQLLQLFDRAHGRFVPKQSAWQRTDGRWCDPFRPRIREDGFDSAEQVAEATQAHLDAVRSMFSSVDTFVFTLGLTECWVSADDGAAFPLAPGVAGGVYDPQRYHFLNFGVDEVVADLREFFARLRSVNPGARMILTVSPVPLAATRSGNHVLHASTLSKAVLRVAAENVCSESPDIMYFPSYEIITAPSARGGYFGPDLRSVAPEGVEHVMGVFMRRVAGRSAGEPQVESGAAAIAAELARALDASCDEQLYARDA